jgi:hypothetical protein
MVFAIVFGSVLMVLIISFIIYFKMKLEEENSKPVSPTPPEGYKRISIKTLPQEWTELERRTILMLENFILFGGGVNQYIKFREDYLLKLPKGKPHDICWSFMQQLILDYGRDRNVSNELQKLIEEFRYQEKEYKKEQKCKRKVNP